MKIAIHAPIVAVAAFLGCSNSSSNSVSNQDVYKVEGRVTLEGKPVGGAVVIFHPADKSGNESTNPRAISDNAGKYMLSYVGDEDGAPAGDYLVTVKSTPGSSKSGKSAVTLPDRYLDPEASGLKVTVKAEPKQVIDLPLKRNP